MSKLDPYREEILRSCSTYAESQAQSAKVDALLGLKPEPIETALVARAREALAQGQTPTQQRWIGLPVQAMNTPYSELAEILERLGLAPNATIVDLGAGYGRLGVVLACLLPGATFIGYELVGERVAEGRKMLERLGLESALLIEQDLAAPSFKPAPADAYFLYDFGSRADVEKTLEDLRDLARQRPLTVVARGRGARNWIERGHPWLAQVIPPEHFAQYSIYRSGG